MAEYIKREALLKAYLDLALAKSKAAKARKGAAAFQGDLFPMVELTEKEWVGLINAAPAADVVEVVHGRWDDGRCTNCAWEAPDFIAYEGYELDDWEPTPYCPNCGARMDGEG